MLEETERPPSAETPASGPPGARPAANAGWFRKGEPGPALRHGGRSRLVAALGTPEQAEARQALAAHVAAIVADLGGPGELTAIAAGMVERHARLELVSDYLFENMQRLGPLTGKGRTRAALTAWLAVVDRLQRSAMTLGLERRQKPVDPIAAIHRAVEEAKPVVRQTKG